MKLLRKTEDNIESVKIELKKEKALLLRQKISDGFQFGDISLYSNQDYSGIRNKKSYYEDKSIYEVSSLMYDLKPVGSKPIYNRFLINFLDTGFNDTKYIHLGSYSKYDQPHIILSEPVREKNLINIKNVVKLTKEAATYYYLEKGDILSAYQYLPIEKWQDILSYYDISNIEKLSKKDLETYLETGIINLEILKQTFDVHDQILSLIKK